MRNFFINIAALSPLVLFASTWSTDQSGNWTTSANWTGGVPNAVNATASFLNVITTARTVTLDASQTVGTVEFDSAYNYTVAPIGTTLTMDVSSGSAAINVTNTFGNSSPTMSVPITIADNLTITQNSSGTLTLSGILGESGGARSVTKSGTGVLIVTGVNTYTGGTTISAGTLRLTADTGLGTSGAVTMSGGTLQAGASFTMTRATAFSAASSLDAQSFTLTMSGVLSGPGLITTLGSGTVVFSNTNTFSGGITVSAGTLSISADDQLGGAGTVTLGAGTLKTTTGITSSRNIVLTGAATIDTVATSSSFSGVFSGVGSLTKIGSGTLTLSGVNTYTGGTILSAGTLSIAADENLGNVSGALTIGTGTLNTTSSFSSARAVSVTGTATINPNATTLTLSGVISGTGSLVKTGAGTLILSGANSYSGGTTVTTGTLQGDSSSLQGQISNAATVIFNQTSDGTYSGVISGAGGLTKQGSGILTITGTSTGFTGATTVSAGTLRVNGSIANSAVTLSSGTTLQGSGTVGPTTSTGGTIKPGNSVGTLTINGALVLNGASTVINEVSPTTSDLLAVTGAATLNGALSVVPESGFYGFGASYTILTSSAVGGTFSSISSTHTNFAPTVTYSPTSVTLNVVIQEPFLDFPFATANERSVGNNIDANSVAGSLPAAFKAVVNTLIGSSNAAVNNALDQMQPAQLSAFAELQTAVGSQILSLYQRHPILPCGCFGNVKVWAHPFGNWMTIKPKDTQVGFHSDSWGLALGFDVELTDEWVLGIGGSGQESHIHWDEGRGYGHSHGLYGGLYSDYTTENFFLGFAAIAGYDWFDAVRRIEFATIDRSAVSSYDGLDMMGQFSSAYFFGAPTCHLFPYANVDLFYLHTHSFREREAGVLNLHIDPYTNWTLRSEAGIGLEVIDKNYDETICISPLVALGWAMDWPLHRDKYTCLFQDQSIPFQVVGWDKTWQLFAVRFGLNIYYHCFTLSATYAGEFDVGGGDPYKNQRFNARLELNW